ncbi:NAD(P)-binding domain-containing protein [Micromonospora sp. NPDC126480]|uniref:NAD(P)-dependent oxidoreductase n=1 Tax=Micromonospora sp. NPDC126480 TaxID=3155312 RepID=UPI00331C289D
MADRCLAFLAMDAVALLGTGTMGTAIGRRLLATGQRLTVWNRTRARADPLVAAGARATGAAAEAVRDADVVITMLTDATAVREVLGAAAGALRPGAHVVEMSTIGPRATRDLARLLPATVPLVDAPVAGSAGAAEAGRLVVLAGGAPAALDRVAPVLDRLGTVRRCGGPGSGAALKLVLNTALVTGVTAVADALAVAAAAGVDRRTAIEALATGPLSGAVARATTTGAAFAVALAAKDARLALAALGDDAPAPVLRAAASVLAAAPHPHDDIATLIDAPEDPP